MSIRRRISEAWRSLLGRATEKDTGEEDAVVSLRRELGSARLDLQAAQDALAAERGRRTALEKAQAGQTREAVESEVAELFTRLAAPLSQLRLQAALLADGKPVAPADIMALALSLADHVEQAGLEPLGVTGQPMPFDPELAQPLMPDAVIEKGDEVVVRFIGYRYRGQVIRKALVERTR